MTMFTRTTCRVRQVGIHGQQVAAGCVREAGRQRAAVPWRGLLHDPRPVVAGHGPRAIVRVASEQQELVVDVEPLQRDQEWQQEGTGFRLRRAPESAPRALGEPA
jgi:hypothetical protein